MWVDSHLDNKVGYFLHIEASTKCNAACPFCSRYLSNTPNVNPDLRLVDLTVDKLDKWLGPTILRKVNTLLFCGNFGDPIVNPHLEDILEYILNINSNIHIYFSTNGGARNSKFWKNLANLLSRFKEAHMVFSIDGLEDTNHLYRRRVQWHRVMENARNFIEAGGHAEWQFLVFKHNQHQVEEARTLSKSLGFKQFTVKNPTGMEDVSSKTYFSNPVFDKDGKHLYNIDQADHLIRPDFKYNGVRGHKHLDLNSSLEVTDYNFDKSKHDFLNSFDIDCSVKDINNRGLYLTADGHFFPCCWMGYYSQIIVDSDQALDLYDKIGGRDGCNLNYFSFQEIFQKWEEHFVSKWNKSIENGKCLVCSYTCGIQNPNYIFEDEKLDSFKEKPNLI